MKKRDPFIVGTWYHCYNRGIENRRVFEDPYDYNRFLELLYLANESFPLRRHDIGDRKFEEVLNLPRGKKLVAIGAFCLLPNRFDLVLREDNEGGITSFMRKIGTAYTLYFNARHKRVGNLFLKPFKSSAASTDRAFQHLVSYVHSTPAALYEPEWEINHVVDPQFLEEQLSTYPYSSLGASLGISTPTRSIIDSHLLATARRVPLQKRLQEARQYRSDFRLLS